ncbi:MAG: glycosyltransferase family 2 protein [Candidatus Omnitrophica bacterium]|nr:glycosyltransferase family 2 protein [Candidatus Omnitrophota bacterium]
MVEINKVEVSVVLPCLNEEETIGICIEKIKDVFLKENIKGEVIIVDNGSTDHSKDIALKLEAKVIEENRKGYGFAYLKGLKEAKGKYIIIGDSDNTYDFYQIPKFLKPLKEGYDFVIGSRFKGKIHKGAMNWSHRYIGNPILSGMCKIFFRTNLSDIHCGMRAFTKEAYQKMDLLTTGMEFATEMVVRALMNNFKICEVPIDYYPRKGKSKLVPLVDAWRHIRFMLMFCPVWLYFIPATFGLSISLGLLLLLLKGPFLFLGHHWDIHLMVYLSVFCILFYQLLHLGIYAHTYAIRQGFLKYDNFTLFFKKHFNLERGIILGGIIFLVGFFISLAIFLEWLSRHFGALYRIRESIVAMTFMVIGIQTIFSSFFISLLFVEKE